jgi:hypothetical protein
MLRLSRWVPLLLAAVVLLSAANEAQARYNGNLNLFVGQKWLNQGDWAPVDQQRQIGLMLAFGEERAAVHFSIDVMTSKDDSGVTSPTIGGPVRASSAEFAIGVRKVWGNGVTRPHLGAGANVIRVTAELSGPAGLVTSEDRGYGVWLDAGVSFRLAGHLNLGIEARYCAANVDLESTLGVRDTSAGGIQLGLLVGYGW